MVTARLRPEVSEQRQADANAPTFESDVFEKRDGKWLLVSHTILAYEGLQPG
jgi:hypothetical protein